MSAFRVVLGTLEIGVLRAANGEWVFTYSDAFRAQREIQPIVDFPNTDREYRSQTLSPFFALRIPGRNQPVVREFIHQHPSARMDEEILLKKFGLRSIANPFRLVPD